MSRRFGQREQPSPCFPRVSGDEPVGAALHMVPTVFSRVSGDEPGYASNMTPTILFSPRERG